MAGCAVNSIIDHLPRDRDCAAAEVGVDQGMTSALLLARVPTLRLVMVDRWAPAEPGSDYDKTQDTIAHRDETYFAKAKKLALARTDFAGHRRCVEHGNSAAVSKTYADGGFDLVFLDGDHSESGVFGDLEHWWGKVKRGGIMCGHDWEHKVPAEQRRYGVNEAVESWLRRLGLWHVIEWGEDSTWFVSKPATLPDSVQDYRRAIEDGRLLRQVNMGDGEWSCVLGREGENCQGDRYTPALREGLIRTLTDPRTLIGTNAGRKMDAEINAWKAANGVERLLMVRKEVLSGANVRGEIGPLFAAFRKRRVVLIGPAHLRELPRGVVAPAAFVETPLPGAQDIVPVLVAETRDAVRRTGAGVILCCAGMATNVILWELTESLGDQCLMLDMGAIFDPYVGVQSRKHFKRPQMAEAMRKNIEEANACGL